MEIILAVKRRKSADSAPQFQKIKYSFDDERETVMNALISINKGGYTDFVGADVEPIRYECSCLQKRCGACAMVINGRPCLACDARLTDHKNENGWIWIEPLRKFPVIADLVVDRSVIFKNLEKMHQWLADEAIKLHPEYTSSLAYAASECLQCGCCLEICPEFAAEGRFTGANTAVAATRLIAQTERTDRKELDRAYKHNFYEGCAKSLSCKDICPAGIDTEELIARSNAVSVWKRKIENNSTK